MLEINITSRRSQFIHFDFYKLKSATAHITNKRTIRIYIYIYITSNDGFNRTTVTQRKREREKKIDIYIHDY